jgi:hypothetical protein
VGEAEWCPLASVSVGAPVLAEVVGADGLWTVTAFGGGSAADTEDAEVAVVDDAGCGPLADPPFPSR